MAVENSAVADAAVRELTITRILDAPRDLVFKAWTEPAQLAQWWGPRGFTTPECEMDMRPGGIYRCLMRSPEGNEYWWHGVCREIVPPARIVWTCSLDDRAGTQVNPETLLTVTFAEHGGQTRLTLHQTGFDLKTRRDDHHEGWSGALERLNGYLRSVATGA